MARTYRRRQEKFKDWYFENQAAFDWEAKRAESNPSLRSTLFFNRWVKGAKTYQGFLDRKQVMLHSDVGRFLSRNAMRNAPTSFTNLFCERPLRRTHQQQIRAALRRESEDNLLLDPYLKNAAYAYW